MLHEPNCLEMPASFLSPLTQERLSFHLWPRGDISFQDDHFFRRFIFTLYMCALLTCMYTWATHVCMMPAEAGGRYQMLWTLVTDGYELPRGCWELGIRNQTQVLMEEQIMSWTTHEPLLQAFQAESWYYSPVIIDIIIQLDLTSSFICYYFVNTF